MTCPRCRKPLTEAQIKSLWASLTSSKRKNKRGGHNAPGWPKGKPRKNEHGQVVNDPELHELYGVWKPTV